MTAGKCMQANTLGAFVQMAHFDFKKTGVFGQTILFSVLRFTTFLKYCIDYFLNGLLTTEIQLVLSVIIYLLLSIDLKFTSLNTTVCQVISMERREMSLDSLMAP